MDGRKVPKSRTRKSQKKSSGSGPNYGATIGKTNKRTNFVAGAIGVVAVLAIGAFWLISKQTAFRSEDVVSILAKQGQSALTQVRIIPVQGSKHLGIGQEKRYVEPFPTSGDHAASGVKAGFYTRELPKANLVHNLEHGNIVIYYETPGDEVIEALKEWTSLYRGAWNGVVATASPGLGEVVVMTAWSKLLRLEQFELSAAAAFMDAYRGRGPERAVR